MTDIPKKLSETARTVLTFATTRTDHLVRPPKLPAAAARQVIRSLLKGGLVEEVPAPIEDTAYTWRTNEDGATLMLQATALGLARIAEAAGTREVPMTDEAAAFAAGSKAFASQRQDVGTSDAPTVVTATTEANPPPLATTAEAASTGEAASNLRPTLRRRPSCAHTSQRSGYSPADRASPARRLGRSHQPRARQHWRTRWSVYCPSRCPGRTRSGTPQQEFSPAEGHQAAQVLAMLRREGGASGPAIAEAMGWAPHTVRGFLAGLSKKGVTVEVLERVRQVGPNKAGAKGSYTVYRVADASGQ